MPPFKWTFFKVRQRHSCIAGGKTGAQFDVAIARATVTGLTRKQHVDSGHRGRGRPRRRHRFGMRIDEQARQRVDQNAERWDNVASAAASAASIEQQLIERSDDRRGTRWPRLTRLKKITEPDRGMTAHLLV